MNPYKQAEGLLLYASQAHHPHNFRADEVGYDDSEDSDDIV